MQKNSISNALHVILLILLSLLFASYVFAPVHFLIVNRYIYPVVHYMEDFILFIPWISRASYYPYMTAAYMKCAHLIFFMMFLNVFFAAFRRDKQSQSMTYSLSMRGFHSFLEDVFYGKVSPSISLSRSRLRRHVEDMKDDKVITKTSLKEFFSAYLKERALLYFILMAIFFFSLMPYLIAQDIGRKSGLATSFIWLAIMIYGQTRIFFEMLLFVCGYFGWLDKKALQP